MKQTLTLVKVGGGIVEIPSQLKSLLTNFSNIKGHKALVHGGGRSATILAEKLGIKTQMIDGRRITDRDMLQVVTMVYAGLINKNIVAALQSLHINALGLTGADMDYMQATKRPTTNNIDYGYVGDIKKVKADTLSQLIHQDIVPILAPLTHDGKGNLLNTNADTIAAQAAQAFAKHFDVKLIYCFEKKGVLLDPQDEESVIPHITPELYTKFLDKKIIQGGMIPKIDNAFDALQNGVKSVIITQAEQLNTPDKGTHLTLQ